MPEYCYKCQKCGDTCSTFRGMSDSDPRFKCGKCDLEMIRDYPAESFNVGIREYATPLVSQSLAIHPDQIPEHSRYFPDVDVTSDGCPVFHNTRQHSDYLDKIGWDKRSQRKVV